MSKNDKQEGCLKLFIRLSFGLIIALITLITGLVAFGTKGLEFLTKIVPQDYMATSVPPSIYSTPIPQPPSEISSGIPLNIQQQILTTYQGAIQADIAAHAALDSSYFEMYMMGNALQMEQQVIAELKSIGVATVSSVFGSQSYWRNLEAINSSQATMISCEYWTQTFYDAFYNQMRYDPMRLIPQKVTFQAVGANWYISEFDFSVSASMCA